MSWMRGPYGGEGWQISGGKFVTESGLSPMSRGQAQILRDRISRLAPLIRSAARAEGTRARMLAAIGWSETRLQNLGANSVGASGMFGILPSTATWLAGRTVTASELAADPELSARLAARYLVRAAKATGYDAKNPMHLPILASAYNAGYGSGRIRRSHSTPYRMVYDAGADGGYLPRVMRAYNEAGGLDAASRWPWVLAAAAGGALVGWLAR